MAKNQRSTAMSRLLSEVINNSADLRAKITTAGIAGKSTLSDWESGASSPKVEKLFGLASVLDIPLRSLVHAHLQDGGMNNEERDALVNVLRGEEAEATDLFKHLRSNRELLKLARHILRALCEPGKVTSNLKGPIQHNAADEYDDWLTLVPNSKIRVRNACRTTHPAAHVAEVHRFPAHTAALHRQKFDDYAAIECWAILGGAGLLSIQEELDSSIRHTWVKAGSCGCFRASQCHIWTNPTEQPLDVFHVSFPYSQSVGAGGEAFEVDTRDKDNRNHPDERMREAIFHAYKATTAVPPTPEVRTTVRSSRTANV